MQGAINKTYVSKRIMEQYAQERQQRLEQKQQSNKTAKGLSAAAGKTFSEDAQIMANNNIAARSQQPPSQQNQ